MNLHSLDLQELQKPSKEVRACEQAEIRTQLQILRMLYDDNVPKNAQDNQPYSKAYKILYDYLNNKY